MSIVESLRKIEDIGFMNKLRILTATTLIAGATSGIAIKSEVNRQNDPAHQSHHELYNRIYSLQTDLAKSGTLGSNGALLFPQAEVRIPDDPRLKELGQLKNQYDEESMKLQREMDSSLLKTVRWMWVVLGVPSTLLLGFNAIKTFIGNKKVVTQNTS